MLKDGSGCESKGNHPAIQARLVEASLKCLGNSIKVVAAALKMALQFHARRVRSGYRCLHDGVQAGEQFFQINLDRVRGLNVFRGERLSEE